MIEDLLKKIGLSNYEALIYGALLRQSPVGASYMAKRCNLSRSTVYTVLNGLISKGLVGTTYKNEVKQFMAEDVSTLKQLLLQQQGTLEKRLKNLSFLEEKLSTVLGDSQVHIPQVIFFEGQEGLKKIYLSMLREARQNSIMYILRDEFVWRKEWNFVFQREWHERVKRWKQELNITTKLLVNPSLMEKKKERLYKSRKGLDFTYLPKRRMVKQFAVYIMNDVVSILSMENNNLVGIKITNQHLANNFIQLFEALWRKKTRKIAK